MVLAYKNEDEILSEERLLAMADGMASAAVSFNSHGYDQFIQAREELKSAFHKLTILMRIGQYNLMIQQNLGEEKRLAGRRSTDDPMVLQNKE